MRRLLAFALGALLLAAPAASAHGANPNFLSEVGAVTPALDGLRIEVLNRDDRLALTNQSGEDILIRGYDDEPYARIAAGGAVEVNRNSPALYLNEERFGGTRVPANATKDAAPDWQQVSGNGRFEWHDHRMHWMGKGTPPAVKDEDVRTKVFDWRIPIEEGGRAAAISGTLFWTPQGGGAEPSAAAYVGGAALLLVLAGVVLVRRRRARAGAGTAPKGASEAW